MRHNMTKTIADKLSFGRALIDAANLNNADMALVKRWAVTSIGYNKDNVGCVVTLIGDEPTWIYDFVANY